MDCTHYFTGSGKKGRPFRGWGGRVAEWTEKTAPKVEFGTWNPDKADPYNGGTVVFDCRPFDLVMFGANSKTMNSRDKTTQFGFAGLGPDGALRISDLPGDVDARKIFAAGGWLPPSSEEVAGCLLFGMQDRAITPSRLHEEINAVRKKTIEGFGIRSQQLDVTLPIWQILSPIHNVLAAASELLAAKRSEAAAARLQRAQVEVMAAVIALREAGEEPTNASVAGFLLGEPNHSAYHVKEKVRSLKKMLGDEFFRVENFEEGKS
jgi:hypothetical protein